MIRQLFTVSSMIMALGMTPTLAYGGVTRIQETNQSKNGQCTGTIIDPTGEPVIGATVTVKGKQGGTITDLDGKFVLSDVQHGATICISYIGFEPVEMVWKGGAIKVTLKEDNKTLNEVVVVGYGTQKKVNVTGAVSMINKDVLENRPVTSVTQALQGEVPGLNLSVSNSGGSLDGTMNINIRGTGTLSSGSNSSPLVLVDGVEGDLTNINPNDVESISVLKDAASSSIYGSRAAFGVILVTTKNGNKGKVNVSYSGNVRFNHGIGIPEMANSVEYAKMMNAAQINGGGQAHFSDAQIQKMQDYMDGKLQYPTERNPNSNTWNCWDASYANTNWFDVYYKNWATSQEHNLSLNGGNDKTQWYISGNFLGQNGLLNVGKDRLNRYTLKGKLTTELAPWAKVTYNTSWTRQDFERPSYMNALFFHNVARKFPTQPVTDPNGHYISENEMEQMENGGIQTKNKDFFTNQLAFVFEPIKDWHINVEGTLRVYNNWEHWEVLPVFYYDCDNNAIPMPWSMGSSDYAAGQTRVNEYVYKENYYATNIYSDYSHSFGDHNFKIMGGFNAEKYAVRNISGQKDGLYTPSLPYLSTASAADQVSGNPDEMAVAGFFGRLNYNYADKYMFEANIRYDGSSRFVGGKRWGTFPSFSGGWNIAREKFFEKISDATTITNLKLRGSWGELGNTRLKSWHPTYSSLGVGTKYGWIVNGVLPNYAGNPGLVSASLGWETVRSWNVGLDFGLLNNRLTGSFEYFVRSTLDMVGPAPELSSVLGTGVPAENNCDMKSYGFEFQIGWRDNIKDFKYGVNFNISDAQQEVTRYPNESKYLGKYYKGRKLGDIWGYTTIGIAQTDEEMKAHLAKANQSSLGSNWGAGDIMYADLDGDGYVNSGAYTLEDHGDLRIIGNDTPRYNFGLNLDAAWKGFDIRMFFQGTMKRDLWLDGIYFWGAQGGFWQSNAFKEHLDYWTPENRGAYYPRPLWGGRNRQTQTRYLQNGAYCRLKNLTLGYTLPKTITSKAGMQSVRVYMSCENVFTITSLSKIFDPENIGSLYGGSGKTYPLQSTVSFGLNVNF